MAIHRQLALCRRIRGLREQRGWTQNQVADALYISQAAYSRLEQGEVELPMSKMFALGDLYGIGLDELVKGI